MNQKLLMELLQDIIENIKKEKKHPLIQLPVFMHGQEVDSIFNSIRSQTQRKIRQQLRFSQIC